MTVSLIAQPNRSAFLGEAIAPDVTLILIQFDASIREVYTHDADVTDHPVEDGANVSDHVRDLPDEIEISGWVSNHPIIAFGEFGQDFAIAGGDPTVRAEDFYRELRRIKSEGEPVRLVTSLDQFDEMVLKSIRVRRDKETGNIVDATIRLKQIVIATTETIAAPKPVQTNRSTKTDKGRQTTKPQSEQTDTVQRSVLRGLLD